MGKINTQGVASIGWKKFNFPIIRRIVALRNFKEPKDIRIQFVGCLSSSVVAPSFNKRVVWGCPKVSKARIGKCFRFSSDYKFNSVPELLSLSGHIFLHTVSVLFKQVWGHEMPTGLMWKQILSLLQRWVGLPTTQFAADYKYYLIWSWNVSKNHNQNW